VVPRLSRGTHETVETNEKVPGVNLSQMGRTRGADLEDMSARVAAPSLLTFWISLDCNSSLWCTNTHSLCSFARSGESSSPAPPFSEPA
jgi:hypothetical protein